MERSVENFWIDLALSRYVNDGIDRKTAIELVGQDHVKREEREFQVVEDDVQWGLSVVIFAVTDEEAEV